MGKSLEGEGVRQKETRKKRQEIPRARIGQGCLPYLLALGGLQDHVTSPSNRKDFLDN